MLPIFRGKWRLTIEIYGGLIGLCLCLNHGPAYLHGIKPKRYSYFPCSSHTGTIYQSVSRSPLKHESQTDLTAITLKNPLSLQWLGPRGEHFCPRLCGVFQFMGLGYLIRIRANFIPVVSDVALVNGLKGLVRHWRENPIQPAKGNKKNRKTQLWVMFWGT